MVVEVSQLVTFVSGTAGAVGAVGAASLGLKAILTTFKALRESGLSVRESMDGARRIVETQHHVQQREAMTPEQRQESKGVEAMAMDSPEARQSMKEREQEYFNTPEFRECMRETEMNEHNAFGRKGG